MTTPNHERLTPRSFLIGVQMLFVAFGALVLVPLLAGLDPNVALFTAGAGTLLFQVVTGFSVPVFLASSFAFIAPISIGVAEYGLPATLSGLMAAGVVYILLSLLVRARGVEIVHRVLPPIVTGPVIMVIGLALAPVAIEMATGTATGAYSWQALGVALVSLLATMLTAVFARGLLKLVPIMVGIATGYLLSLLLGSVDFTPIREAAWFAIPTFVSPTFSWPAILFILPVAIAPAIEHVGDLVAIRGVTGVDYLKKPGLHRTLLGDGLATTLASSLGGPPNTTYSEVTGAVALTKAFSPLIMTIAAVTAMLLAFFAKLGAVLATIPAPVMGGILVILFGSIVMIGISTLVRAQVDMTETRNLIIGAVILVFGVGGMAFEVGDFAIAGIGLAGIVGVLLNLLLPTGSVERAG
jgi:uracil permease